MKIQLHPQIIAQLVAYMRDVNAYAKLLREHTYSAMISQADTPEVERAYRIYDTIDTAVGHLKKALRALNMATAAHRKVTVEKYTDQCRQLIHEADVCIYNAVNATGTHTGK